MQIIDKNCNVTYNFLHLFLIHCLILKKTFLLKSSNFKLLIKESLMINAERDKVSKGVVFRIGTYPVQTPLGTRPGLGTQPRYEVDL